MVRVLVLCSTDVTANATIVVIGDADIDIVAGDYIVATGTTVVDVATVADVVAVAVDIDIAVDITTTVLVIYFAVAVVGDVTAADGTTCIVHGVPVGAANADMGSDAR